ncbi:FadR/GntR family transcriptional regulator [Xanthobacteraceae bacterium Astr-EGSB]|uniref:FadR/GntR family transcriptional regulator n=1 Tax=Astrobacterium formosum TaxID=3069710 RepID=UPI0027B84041|nr:FadR/GntR family transcriptional regulator [Xanthobacteraceae bacterium Astr-EGSB]
MTGKIGHNTAPAARTGRAVRTLHHDVVEAISNWIFSGRFAEGAILPNEIEIADELGVSRTVVREAERTLVAKGMLKVRRKTGTVVQPKSNWSVFDRDVLAWRFRFGLDAEFINDLFSFRAGIETFAAELCAAKADLDSAPLAACCQRMEAALNGDGDWFEADLSFHQLLLTSTGNQFILHFVPVLQGLFGALLSPDILIEQNMRATLPRHRDVVDAIAARDPVAARAAMLRLIAEGREDMLRKITEK